MKMQALLTSIAMKNMLWSVRFVQACLGQALWCGCLGSTQGQLARWVLWAVQRAFSRQARTFTPTGWLFSCVIPGCSQGTFYSSGQGGGRGGSSLSQVTSLISAQFSPVTQSCPTLCDPMDRSTPGLSVHRQLPEFTQTHVH